MKTQLLSQTQPSSCPHPMLLGPAGLLSLQPPTEAGSALWPAREGLLGAPLPAAFSVLTTASFLQGLCWTPFQLRKGKEEGAA